MTWAKGKQLSTMTNSEQTLSFKYDANGIRTKKTVNNVEYEYTYVGDKLVRVESDGLDYGPLTIYYTADGKPYSFYYGGGPFYYMLNLQGDVIGIATGNGNVIVEYAYDSWGKPISVTVNNSIYEDIALANPLRYRGYVYDNETGLYYLQSRYYDPELCRFISADAYLVAGNALQGTNMFAYCLNNPVRYSDPSGYLSSTEQVAVNVATIFACLIYIADYAERHDMNVYAVVDFLERTTDEDSKLVNYAEVLEIGVMVLNGDEWLNALFSAKGLYGDLKNIATIALGGKIKISTASGVVSAAINILKDFWNPLMTDDDIRFNAFEHIASAAVGVGVFTAELTAAVTAMTGNPYIGFGFSALVLGIIAFSGI